MNIKHAIVTSIPNLCIWLGLIGAIQATPKTNFFLLAIANTNLYSDLGLKIKQREIIVNLLMVSTALG